MNFIRHINFKKSIAVLLSGLLIFIHVEKTIHHHEKVVSKSHESGFVITTNNFVCSVCDYVFAKDGDILPPTILSVYTGQTQKQEISFLYPYYSAVYFQINGRGPPFC